MLFRSPTERALVRRMIVRKGGRPASDGTQIHTVCKSCIDNEHVCNPEGLNHYNICCCICNELLHLKQKANVFAIDWRKERRRYGVRTKAEALQAFISEVHPAS